LRGVKASSLDRCEVTLELIKLASLATSLGEALRRRGVPDTAAELAAETGVAVLRIALTRWIDDPAERPWEVQVRRAWRLGW